MQAKELEKWLKKQVDFLLENEDFLGSWKKLNDEYAVVVLWEDGWGDKKRDDVIQAKEDLDWGLCAGIKVFDSDNTLDMWKYPWDKETGDLLLESTGILPKEDFEELSHLLIKAFESVKDFHPDEDGALSFVKNLPEPKPQKEPHNSESNTTDND